jgi:pyruvate/2-oxoglutarate dehydrogenase complex dihydrolipoamide acyltransferase (E2) component
MMTTKVLVPLLGEGVEEVTVTKWLKQEGEAIKELEPLLEVNTDKVDTEIPAPASGTILKIVAPEGRPARVGELLAVIGKPGESADVSALQAPSPVAASVVKPAVPAPPPPTPSRAAEVGFLSPVVARIAAERGIDLSAVQGTGLNGRITKNDVLRFAESGDGRSTKPVGGAAPAPRVMPTVGDQLVPHTMIRRQIAEHMVLSQRTSPHVLTVMEADMSRVVSHREANKAAFERQEAKLTFTAYFLAAIVAGLKAFPMTNSTWTEQGVLVHGSVNIGMAVSLGDEGLIVPVVKGADNLSLLAIARQVNDLGTRARAHQLQPDDVHGATFTLTNHGTGGSLLAMPIISQPQCAILGTGAIQKRVVAVADSGGADAFAVRPMVYLSMVFDHRILDGATADAFLLAVKQTLENWS